MQSVFLANADLRGARLEGANLGLARLERANLRAARLDGANLQGASLQSTSWAGATLRSPANDADFRGGQDLSQEHLANVIGNERTLLPDGVAPDTGEPFYVWSCWAEPPPDLDAMLKRFRWSRDKDELRRRWLCADGEAPRKTGTPLALDATPPWADE